MPTDGSYFELGMLVALKSGRIGIIRGAYDRSSDPSSQAIHRRFKVEIGPNHLIDISTQSIIGRVTFRRSHLRAIDISRPRDTDTMGKRPLLQ